VQPSLVEAVGFQLTAAATLGLITMTPELARRWSRLLGRHLATALAVSLAAHVATLPWSIAVFHIWAPGSILLNLVAVPWTAAALPVAATALLLEPVALLGDWTWRLFAGLAAPYEWLSRLPTGAPWSLAVARPAWCVALSSAALAFGFVRLGAKATLLLALALCAYLSPLASAAPHGLEMVAFDVGQGEALLLRDGREALLIDGGGWRRPGVGQRVLLPALLELGVRELRGVVLTHPDRDHCGGLLEIVHLIPVRTLWSATGWAADCYRDLVRIRGVTLSPVWRGRRLQLGRWSLEVLHPAAGERRLGNDSSLVLRAMADGWSVLLTGDIGEVAEARLLAELAEALPAEVLKVGHHGSRFSSGAEFLDRVSPRLALISAGDGNVYGHPADDVLERLAGRRIDVWRTDRGGQIRLRVEAAALHVEQPWGSVPSDRVSYNPRHGIDRRDRRADGDR
ncbi:MAG: ComEC/Rec2 family competence protein, partial [Thermoanaerobaculia bacterium]